MADASTAFITYLLLRRRHGQECAMQEFLAGDDVVRPRAERLTTEEAVPVSPAPAQPQPDRQPVGMNR